MGTGATSLRPRKQDVEHLQLYLESLLPIPEKPTHSQLAYWWCANLQIGCPLGPLIDRFIDAFCSQTRKEFSHIGGCRYDELLPYRYLCRSIVVIVELVSLVLGSRRLVGGPGSR